MRKHWIFLGLCISLLLLRVEEAPANLAADGAAQIPAETNYVALTFDDGPRRGTTDRLLEGLKERGASATFFLVGEEAERYPELVRRMQAEGHQVGNHTWSHVRLEGASTAVIQEEVGKTEELLETLLGGSGYWLRPPYGLITPGTEKLVRVPMVKWSVDPRDWENKNTDKVVQAILKHVKPNSIILLHDIYDTSVDAALKVVDTLEAQGYCFVTVEELLCLNGVTPEAGELYRTGTGTT
ncbi:polysaccharide deacetylase family protein [Oscillibacter valericigenes]|uniref:polysaccharide deacetylase family protein n=1 Tax=Oscillibacter valericigenes TaxID=351091 RepID=UPI001F264AD6|nr:polysaccharide deacetylase family protein [Oscillibacter valericigenes]MCF2663411.1 polysaccharide deacetylase family protein [Oscillibacter valericigenes]